MRGYYVYKGKHGDRTVSLVYERGAYGLMTEPPERTWTTDPVEALHMTADAIAMLEGRDPDPGDGPYTAPDVAATYIHVRTWKGRLHAYFNTSTNHRHGRSVPIDPSAERALRQVAEAIAHDYGLVPEPVAAAAETALAPGR